MIKKEIEKIESSLKTLKDCIEIKRCVTKEDLDDNIKIISTSLEKLKETSGKMIIPHPVSNPDFTRLIGACDEYLQEIEEYGFCTNSDLRQWIHEESLKAIYGEDIFEWINSQKGRK